MVVLTEHLVKAKTRLDNLLHVKNLNVWGSDITDVGIIRNMPNIQVLSLSVNRIGSLRDFAFCPRLAELYLRKNDVREIQELQHLNSLPGLRVLWLCENPIADHADYRLAAIACCPALEKLDDKLVSAEEREAAREFGPSFFEPTSGGVGGGMSDLRHPLEAHLPPPRYPSGGSASALRTPAPVTGAPVPVSASAAAVGGGVQARRISPPAMKPLSFPTPTPSNPGPTPGVRSSVPQPYSAAHPYSTPAQGHGVGPSRVSVPPGGGGGGASVLSAVFSLVRELNGEQRQAVRELLKALDQGQDAP